MCFSTYFHLQTVKRGSERGRQSNEKECRERESESGGGMDQPLYCLFK